MKKGELGLRQSDAVFHHTQQIPDLLDALWKDDYVPKAVGVSVKPRKMLKVRICRVFR